MKNFLIGITLLLGAISVHAQTTLLTLIPLPPDLSPLPPSGLLGVEADDPVSVNVRTIALNESVRRQFVVPLPDGSSKTFNLKRFNAKNGFIQLGEFDLQPDPALPDSALEYTWYGTSSTTESLFVSVYKGRPTATLIAARKTYEITKYLNTLVLRRFNPDLIPRDFNPGAPATPTKFADGDLSMPATPKYLDHIDVLVVATPAALALAGSQANLDDAVVRAFGQSAEVIQNSGITTFDLRNVNSGGNPSIQVTYNETPGVPAGCNVGFVGADGCRWIGHRQFMRTDTTIQGLRNSSGADLVVMVVADRTGSTGVAYTQRPNCGVQTNIENTAGCSVGAGYNNFAVAAVSYTDITSFQVFAHETGHMLGMEHNLTSNGTQPANASFVWSFGWFANGVKQSIMTTTSQSSCSCPRELQYSNPNIKFLGTATDSGTASAFNAKTGALLAPATSDFRNPILISVLFRSGFDDLPVP
jgi:Metallo-peptidase family M12B Reprolysin-like